MKTSKHCAWPVPKKCSDLLFCKYASEPFKYGFRRFWYSDERDSIINIICQKLQNFSRNTPEKSAAPITTDDAIELFNQLSIYIGKKVLEIVQNEFMGHRTIHESCFAEMDLVAEGMEKTVSRITHLVSNSRMQTLRSLISLGNGAPKK